MTHDFEASLRDFDPAIKRDESETYLPAECRTWEVDRWARYNEATIKAALSLADKVQAGSLVLFKKTTREGGVMLDKIDYDWETK